MKNLTKIFMAVAAGMLAFSCVTDATDDLAPELGLGEGQATTTLTLSLEESRTHLGEKVGELYPLYWSTDDQIAVNGTPSDALSEEYDGKAAARFSFGENTVSRPFHVIYPAPAEGVEAKTEGCYPVVFPATQTYAEGTFAAGTAPMYGYAAAPAEGEEAAPVQMQHLTGILRLAVKGDVTLSTLVIKAESGKLSGTYDVNCESGALTAQEGSTSDTVTLSFDGGLTLKADEATPIYVAVPAGSYGAVRAILTTTEGKKMTIKFDSDSKPIAKATVREFTEFTFAENALDGDVFEIYNVEDMLMFAKTATSFPWSEAKLMATVDMTGVEWTPVDGFSKIFNGNYSEATPYEIKNLSAPLFGTTTATIKNVKLTDVNITSNDRKYFGALACEVYCATDEKTVLENCEVHGKIVVENKNLTLSSDDKDVNGSIGCGGLVGVLNGGDVVGCKNYATITVKQIAALSNEITTIPVFGGLVGKANSYTSEGGTTVTGSFSDCENRGELKYEDNATAFLYRAIVAGIVGCTATAYDAVLTNCDNYANISLDSVVTGNAGGTTPAALAGVVGYFYHATAVDCDNSGSITFDGKARMIAVGGLFGYSSNSVHRNCHNTGAIELKESSRVLGIMVGGVGAALYNPNDNAVGLTDNCSNNATIQVLCSTNENDMRNGAYYYRVGGITAFGRQPITNSDNMSNGDITISGKWIHMSSSERSINLAGAIGYKTKGVVTNVNNYGDLTISSDITINSTNTDIINVQPLNIGGVVSDSSYSVTANNYGSITFSGSYTGYRVFIGGILANGIDNNVRPYPNCTNTGNIHITEDATFTISNYLYVGGCCAASEASQTDLQITNSGDITIDGTINQVVTENTDGTTTSSGGNCRVGGVMGYFTLPHTNLTNSGDVKFGNNAVIYGSSSIGGVVGTISSTTTTYVFSDYTNNGTITFNGNNKGDLTLGGITGRPYGATIQNMDNNGEINLNGVYDGRIYLGGCFGYHGTDKIVKLVNCENTASITVQGTYNNTSGAYIAGVCGYMQGAGTHSQIYNREGGEITINPTKMAADLYVAGVTGKFQDTSTDVENHGDIYVKGSYDKSVYIAGLIATSNNYVRTNHINAGNVTVEANIGSTLCIGGLYSYGPYGKTTDFTNTGNFTVEKNTNIQNSAYIGGVYGYYTGSESNFNLTANGNSGDFTFAGKCGLSTTPPAAGNYNQTYGLYMGGMIGQTRAGTHKITVAEGFVNSGKMEFTGSCDNGSVYIGGLVGDMSTSTTGWTGSLINTGNIICTGTYNNEGYAGGIFGRTTVSTTDAQSFCSIRATNTATKVGWITGSTRSNSVKATNCKIGGTVLVYDEQSEDYNEQSIADKYYNYIYGSGADTDWTGTDNYDGCTYLSTKDQIETTPAE